jgi:hypothetical protein
MTFSLAMVATGSMLLRQRRLIGHSSITEAES